LESNAQSPALIEAGPKNVRGAWWATLVLFLVHGSVVSTWVSRIPAVQSNLKLNNAVLGITLLGSALGAVLTIPLAGWLVTRYGSKRISVFSALCFCSAVVILGTAFNALTLASALFFYGASAATMDVAMNAQGVEVEKALGASTMSRFHAMFSLGGMVGAAIGGLIAEREISPLAHFSGSAIINAVAVAAASTFLLETRRGSPDKARRLAWSKIPPVLLALACIAFCSLLAEGAMADWTAIYFRQILKASAGIAASGYAVFSAAMALSRFVGDWMISRLGSKLALRSAALTASAGLTWALLVHSIGPAFVGFAAAGVGFSIIIPIVYGGGGRIAGITPGAGIATITGIGYIGFIVGPPTIGVISEAVTLRYALFVVVACCLIGAALSGAVPESSVRGICAAPEL
jgi:MFS family permease